MGKRFAMLISVAAAGVMALGGDRDARETVTQTMTRTGVGGGDLSGAVDDSRE